MSTETAKVKTKLNVGAEGVGTPLNKGDKRVASSPLESDNSDLKKQRHISGGSHTYVLGETSGDLSPVHLLSQPMYK